MLSRLITWLIYYTSYARRGDVVCAVDLVYQEHDGDRRTGIDEAGTILINVSLGAVVDIPTLCNVLISNHLASAVIDVLSEEPVTNSGLFNSLLYEFDNVLLTPHSSATTQEAQENIGNEVTDKLAKYSDNDSILSAVNFLEMSLPVHMGKCQLLTAYSLESPWCADLD